VRRLPPALLLSVALAAPAAATAEAAPPPPNAGILLGVRAGYALPFGDVASDEASSPPAGPHLKDLVPGKIPLWLEVGYRFNPHFHGELFMELAPSFVASRSCAQGPCSALGISFGAEIQVHALPTKLVDPWLGVGFGVELLDATVYDPSPPQNGTPGRFEMTWRGVEVPRVDGGLDIALSSRLTVGPYVTASFAQFTSFTSKPVGKNETTHAVEDRATHVWLQAGLRLRLSL
jgi:hypothetical protein